MGLKVTVPHPYARIYAKKDAKRRRIWNHALEKSVFSPLQLSTVGAQDRRPIYVSSLEAHIDRLHEQLKAIDCYPVTEQQLLPYIGLHSKVAKSMVSSLQHDISQTNLKLLELERANAKLRESLGLPPKAPPVLVSSPPPRPRIPYTFPDLSHLNSPVPPYSQASTPAHYYSNAIALPSLPEPSSLSFYSSQSSSSSSDASSTYTSSPIYSTPTSPSSLASALSPVSPIDNLSISESSAYCTQENSPIDTDFSMLSRPYYPPPRVQPPAYDENDAYRHELELGLQYPAAYCEPPTHYELAYTQPQQQPSHPLPTHYPSHHQQHQQPQQHSHPHPHPNQQQYSHPQPSYPTYPPYLSFASPSHSSPSHPTHSPQQPHQHQQPSYQYTYHSPGSSSSSSWMDSDSANNIQSNTSAYASMQPSMHPHPHSMPLPHTQYHYQSVSLQAF